MHSYNKMIHKTVDEDQKTTNFCTQFFVSDAQYFVQQTQKSIKFSSRSMLHFQFIFESFFKQ